MESEFYVRREGGWPLQGRLAGWITYIEFCVCLILCQTLRVFQANRTGVEAEEGRHRGIAMGTLRKTLWMELDN